MLNFSFDNQILKIMQTRGLDRSVLQGSRIKFDLEESIVSFKPDLGSDLKSKNVNQTKQLKVAQQMLENPFHGSPVVCINSYPTDLRAKVLAANIMESAVFEYLDRKEAGKPARLPYWARLYSDVSYGYIEKIKDQKPGLLIVSNITSGSTPARLEKLRDILDYFDNIPRIVVQTGDDDPVKFFSRRVFLSITHAIRIGPENRVATPLDIL